LYSGVGGRHHNTDAFSKSQTIWHGKTLDARVGYFVRFAAAAKTP
jgi:hypothetical protein